MSGRARWLLLLVVPLALAGLAMLLVHFLRERVSQGTLALIVTLPFAAFLLVLWRLSTKLQEGLRGGGDGDSAGK